MVPVNFDFFHSKNSQSDTLRSLVKYSIVYIALPTTQEEEQALDLVPRFRYRQSFVDGYLPSIIYSHFEMAEKQV